VAKGFIVEPNQRAIEEDKSASSLLTALTRAEASSATLWSKADRRAALIYLAHNRQLQIKRIRDYMNRGRFPLNEGQSPDAIPIFVDRHETHCAVGHLMHSDGKDAEVAQIVSTNNLVRIRGVEGGDMVQWIRTSGLTQEEAAMIQPSYPFGVFSFDFLNAGFGRLPLSLPNDITLLDVSVRGARFHATLPASFESNPGAIDAILDQGIAELENNNVVGPAFESTRGIFSGASGTRLGVGPQYPYEYDSSEPAPSNLDTWLYFGPKLHQQWRAKCVGTSF